jgi:hypothetical protein
LIITCSFDHLGLLSPGARGRIWVSAAFVLVCAPSAPSAAGEMGVVLLSFYYCLCKLSLGCITLTASPHCLVHGRRSWDLVLFVADVPAERGRSWDLPPIAGPAAAAAAGGMLDVM